MIYGGAYYGGYFLYGVIAPEVEPCITYTDELAASLAYSPELVTATSYTSDNSVVAVLTQETPLKVCV